MPVPWVEVEGIHPLTSHMMDFSLHVSEVSELTSHIHSKMKGMRFRTYGLMEIAQSIKSRTRMRSECSSSFYSLDINDMAVSDCC